MRRFVELLIRRIALKTGRLRRLYALLNSADGFEYAEILKRHGGFVSIGEHCSILPSTGITDPPYVRIGNNVSLSQCTLIGHDGSIAILNRAYGVRLDRVGKIDIKDNVFVGFGAIILPGVTIGPNAIVGAGAVVTRDVAEGDIVAGVPAKPVGRVDALVKKLQAETRALPWASLIEGRDGPYDAAIEPELIRQRVAFWYGGGSNPVPSRNGPG
jgi:acetyltransferase-like isoleucine patch superfamily enzyme